MIIDLKQKSQVTIPKKLVEKLSLKIGDKIDIEEKDGRLVLTPVIMVPKDQAWFYTPEWQKDETEVDRQLKEGKIHVAETVEKLFKDLGI
ncbi:MAG: AbrB/MazE/SpoVT family DNA-binding domain-containing protein [Actinobacteria bacterium]|nr:AbrB/MazE/SpoVT family DNA-binding domain-containing protein [Actinomycetota bacterium]